jgi:hypothetical protein
MALTCKGPRAVLKIAREERTNHIWCGAREKGTKKQEKSGNGGQNISMSYQPHSQRARTAPDALDKLRDTVHRVAVMRHDAAHAATNMHQPPVTAREEQHPALALAVARQGYLPRSHVPNKQQTWMQRASTRLHRARSSVCVKVDPAASGGGAAKRNGIGRVCFKSRQHASARLVAHDGSQLRQRDKQLVVPLVTASSHSIGNAVMHRS